MQRKPLKWAVRALLAAAVLTVSVAAASSTAACRGEHLYVLAIGDSMTAGTMPLGPQAVPFGSPAAEVTRSGQGYADQLVASLRRQGMNVELVNLACNRETTETMMTAQAASAPTRRSRSFAKQSSFCTRTATTCSPS